MRALYALRHDATVVGSSQENDILAALSQIRLALETWSGRNVYISTLVISYTFPSCELTVVYSN